MAKDLNDILEKTPLPEGPELSDIKKTEVSYEILVIKKGGKFTRHFSVRCDNGCAFYMSDIAENILDKTQILMSSKRDPIGGFLPIDTYKGAIDNLKNGRKRRIEIKGIESGQLVFEPDKERKYVKVTVFDSEPGVRQEFTVKMSSLLTPPERPLNHLHLSYL